MASISVSVTSLLDTPPLVTAPLGWKSLAFEAAVGGDTVAAGNSLRDSIIARWLSAFPDTGGATVQVSLIDPDGIGPDAATLIFQFAGRPIATKDGTITLGQIDQAGLQAVLASFAADLTEVDAVQQLNDLVSRTIAQGRSMISAGHAGFSADDVAQWDSVLKDVQGRVAAFASTHPDAAQSVQTISTTLNNYIGSEAAPFSTEHADFLKMNQPPKSYGEKTEESVKDQMNTAQKLMDSDSVWDHMMAGYAVEGAANTAEPYAGANFFSGGNLEVSRQFHQAFREGHISLDDFESGSTAAAHRGEWIGAANAILIVASFGLAGPILGAAPSTASVIFYGGASAAISTAIPMAISRVYTDTHPMANDQMQQVWSQGAYSGGQIAVSSAISFGIGAGLGAISRIGAKMPESSMQELVVASTQGRSLATIPGIQAENLGPGLVRLTIEGEPGYVELTRGGFTAYAPAGPSRTPTVVHSAPWVEPMFAPGAIAENPFLGNVQGNASYMNAQTGQGMSFGVTSEGYFAYAPRTSTPFIQGPFPAGEAGPVSVPGMAPFEMPMLGPGVPMEAVPPVLGPNPAGAAEGALTEVQAANPALPIESQLRISRALSLFPQLKGATPSVDQIRSLLSQAGLQLHPEEVWALREAATPGAVYPPAPEEPSTPEFAAEIAKQEKNLDKAEAGIQGVLKKQVLDADPVFKNMDRLTVGKVYRAFDGDPLANKNVPRVTQQIVQKWALEGAGGDPREFSNRYEFARMVFGNARKAATAAGAANAPATAAAEMTPEKLEELLKSGITSVQSLGPKNNLELLPADATPTDIADAVKRLNRIGFESDFAEAYHAIKHVKEVPLELRKSGDPVKDYAAAYLDTIKKGKVISAGPVPPHGSIKIIYEWIPELEGTLAGPPMQAKVYVRPDGTVTIATFGKKGEE